MLPHPVTAEIESAYRDSLVKSNNNPGGDWNTGVSHTNFLRQLSISWIKQTYHMNQPMSKHPGYLWKDSAPPHKPLKKTTIPPKLPNAASKEWHQRRKQLLSIQTKCIIRWTWNLDIPSRPGRKVRMDQWGSGWINWVKLQATRMSPQYIPIY